MRKLALSLAVLATAGLSSAAFAANAPATVTGAIKALDAKACTVTLDNSTVYHFEAKCDFSKLKVGEKVTITWTSKNNEDWASKIVAAS